MVIANEREVAQHYKRSNLLGAIKDGLKVLGKTPQTITINDLAPVDEFHIGGRAASQHFLDQLGFNPGAHILDIGCGLGGAARFAANQYDVQVCGIDLTSEYIETGRVLCEWIGVQSSVHLYQGNALTLPFLNSKFHGAYMMHVGMNVENKPKLFSECFRVLKTGASFGVYDIMTTKDGKLSYPVPWAAGPKASYVVSSNEYIEAMEKAGFKVKSILNRRDFALQFFKDMQAKNKKNGPPPLGLHTLMQNRTAQKINNMIETISAGRIAPTEIIAVKL